MTRVRNVHLGATRGARVAAEVCSKLLALVFVVVSVQGSTYGEEKPVIEVSGRVLDQNGRGVPRARVLLGDWHMQFEKGSRAELVSGSTAQDGSFRLHAKSSWAPNSAKGVGLIRAWAEQDGRRSPERVMRVSAAGGPLKSPPLVLERLGAALVKVSLHDGRPAVQADVVLHLNDPSLRFDDDPRARYHVSGRTDSSGSALIQGVLPRTYRRVALGVKLGNRARQWFRLRDAPLDRKHGRVSFAATLDQLTSVSGVLQAAPGDSLGRLLVAAVRTEGPSYLKDLHWQAADSTGRFTLRDCVLPRSVLWIAAQEPKGAQPSDRLPVVIHEVDVRGTEMDIGKVQIPRLGTLRLEIRREGALVESGWVRLERADYRSSGGPTIPINGGRAEFLRVPGGASLRVTVYPGTHGLEPEGAALVETFGVRGTNQVHVLSLGLK